MFYRLKFDGIVGGILKRCGYQTSETLNFWPTGATPEWVKRGKSKSWKPVEAAALGVSQTALELVEAGQMSVAEAQLIAMTAHTVALEMKVRDEVSDHLILVAYELIPNAKKEN